MGRRNRKARRTQAQAAADAAADGLAKKLGKMLRHNRDRHRPTQAQASARAALSRSEWSHLEVSGDGRVPLATWNRAAAALASSLEAYLTESTASDQPRDAVHLRHQELILRTATAGGWHGLPEATIDRDAGRSRAADVLLRRGQDHALVEVWNWFDDVGAALRAWPRRLDAVERLAIARMVGNQPLPSVSGCWAVRATRRNRELITDHRHVFSAVLPGYSRGWLTALTTATTPMPPAPGLLWVTVNGSRLYPARLG